MRTSGLARAGQVAAGVGRLLPAAVLSVFVVVIAAAFLGANWGSLATWCNSWPASPL